MKFDFEIHPYQSGTWADPVTDPRRSSAVFRTEWGDTLGLLDYETAQLDVASPVIIEVDLPDWDIRSDRTAPLARARPGHPGVVVSFECKLGPMRYATDAYEQRYKDAPQGWRANVHAIALTLKALRDLDRWGVSKRGQQYTGWLALPKGGDVTFPSADEALRWMKEHRPRGFLGDSASDLYRALAKRWHAEGTAPDETQWERLQAARLLLMTAGLM